MGPAQVFCVRSVRKIEVQMAQASTEYKVMKIMCERCPCCILNKLKIERKKERAIGLTSFLNISQFHGPFYSEDDS